MRDTAGGTPALPFEEAISSISYSLKKLPLPQNLWVKRIVLEQTKNDCEDGCQ
jgi:hypothetical protein